MITVKIQKAEGFQYMFLVSIFVNDLWQGSRLLTAVEAKEKVRKIYSKKKKEVLIKITGEESVLDGLGLLGIKEK